MNEEELNLVGLEPFQFQPLGQSLHDTECELRQKRYAKLATRYSTKEVIVGEITEVWEDYGENKYRFTVEIPLQTDDFKGMQRAECFISLSSPAEVSSMSTSIYTGRIAVIEKANKQVLAIHHFY